ncbi:hypothetical protein MVEN_00070000 [Mycena venus]|uniref:Uncharacterized protein n=1 Tax=Mycena venus TaxID=2733690 RepID=A0A8H6Z7C9_9AGAR|nr:hypothetical protein MVEN_00070000 [Mycena venus]
MPFKYSFADQGSKTTPCRNVPVVCGLCPSTLPAGKPNAAQPAFWRYNMEEHLATVHLEYTSPRNPDAQQRLPHAVWTSMALEASEERALGIPPSKIPVPFSRVAGPDEGVEETALQLGVKRCQTIRKVPPVVGSGARKRRKANLGAAVASGSGQ